MMYKSFDKKSTGRGIKNEIKKKSTTCKSTS